MDRAKRQTYFASESQSHLQLLAASYKETCIRAGMHTVCQMEAQQLWCSLRVRRLVIEDLLSSRFQCLHAMALVIFRAA